MRVIYFPDTDTALIEFRDAAVAETRELGEDIYVDLDENGKLVSLTIEHARANARLEEFSLREMPQGMSPRASTG
ncbi:DUF2283 domain-containing protein [Deferrisoma palaeochoriense]